MIGLHIIADLKQVDFSQIKLNEKNLKKLISSLLKKHNLTELGNYYHTFSKKNEITCIVALAESHISIHTWPDKKYISLDIFVCNFGKNNSSKAKKIYQEMVDFFKPKEIKEVFLDRES